VVKWVLFKRFMEPLLENMSEFEFVFMAFSAISYLMSDV